MDYIRDYTGDYYRGMKADSGSLDYSSHEGDGLLSREGLRFQEAGFGGGLGFDRI